jgi:hypothetical protein
MGFSVKLKYGGWVRINIRYEFEKKGGKKVNFCFSKLAL